jgi:capsular polysaccharide biosynthesis protein
MDTSEAPKTNGAGGFSPAQGPRPESDPLFSGDGFTAKSSRPGSRGVLRRLAGLWFQILMLWLLISAPIIALIYALVKPTYLATCLMQVETPVGKSLTHLQAQVTSITSDNVLGAAVANPLVVNLPTIKQSEDPRKVLRERLKVQIVGGTPLIRISLELANHNEAIAIVDAVAQSYVAQYEDRNQPQFNKITEDQLLKLIDQQVRNHREFRNAQSQLEEAQALRKRRRDEVNAELLDRVREEFLKLPAVAELVDQIREFRGIGPFRHLTPPPEMSENRRKYKRLTREYENLWASEYSAIRERVTNEVQSQMSHARIQELEAAVRKARSEKESFAKQLEKIVVVGDGPDDLNEPVQGGYLVTLIEPASASKSPARDNRVQFMFAAALAVLVLLVGSFLTHDLKAGRIAPTLPN